MESQVSLVAFYLNKERHITECVCVSHLIIKKTSSLTHLRDSSSTVTLILCAEKCVVLKMIFIKYFTVLDGRDWLLLTKAY